MVHYLSRACDCRPWAPGIRPGQRASSFTYRARLATALSDARIGAIGCHAQHLEWGGSVFADCYMLDRCVCQACPPKQPDRHVDLNLAKRRVPQRARAVLCVRDRELPTSGGHFAKRHLAAEMARYLRRVLSQPAPTGNC